MKLLLISLLSEPALDEAYQEKRIDTDSKGIEGNSRRGFCYSLCTRNSKTQDMKMTQEQGNSLQTNLYVSNDLIINIAG